MNELQIFNSEEFGDIRTVTIENEPWFVGKDVAEALGYARTRRLILEIRPESPVRMPLERQPYLMHLHGCCLEKIALEVLILISGRWTQTER